MSAETGQICVFCGGKQVDSQTGRCLNCGKLTAQPSLGHPVLDAGLGAPRRSVSAAYRPNGSATLADAPPLDPPAAEPHSPPPVDEPPEAPVMAAALGISQARADKWLDETRALRDGLLAGSDKAEAEASDLDAHAATLRAQATRSRAAAAKLSALIETAVTISGARWARLHDACIDCGTTARPHCAKGRCRPCDDEFRRSKKKKP